MKFKELREILKEMGSLASVFDPYKPLREPLRGFIQYLREKYLSQDESFWDRTVPEDDLKRFNPLYQDYCQIYFQNTGKRLETMIE